LTTPLIGVGATKVFPEGWHENLAVRISQRFDVAFDVAEHLARNYGTRAADVLAEVDADSIKGSRSGLYKHYPRLYEGAAATTGYPYLEAEVRYAIDYEYAVTPADILARRTRLAFLNSTAARLALPKVVEIMAASLGWDEARQVLEHEKAEQLLAQDFAGPAPNKRGATLRTACTADVKDIFDQMDMRKRGYLCKDGIEKAAQELGFPLTGSELHQAVSEMDTSGEGEVSFPEFLAWWNNCQGSHAVQKKIFIGVRTGSKWATASE
jgi:glycerol-3-phosphate dehydrogenase